jgi:hypothetical protein
MDNSRSLISHDGELPICPWKEEVAARNSNRRHWMRAITLLLTPLVIFFVWDLQRRIEFDIPGPKLSGYPYPGQEPGYLRDLKWLLHPEDHTSRDLGIRHFLWNITKASMAPNGVKKEIFLINGTTNLHLALRLGSAHKNRSISRPYDRNPLW